MKNLYDVIRRPLLTEKSTQLKEQQQTLVFEVHRDATKPEIKKAVETLFKVKVKAVNTIKTKGKVKAWRGKRYEKGDVKKAVVTLAEGHQIDVTTGL